MPGRRLPGRFSVPVVGVTFRANDYPRNLHVLAEILTHLSHVQDDPDALRFFHHKRFRPIMEECLAHGRVPVVLRRDYDNPASAYAVRVAVPLLETVFIGYVPENSHGGPCIPLSQELDADVAWHGWVKRVRIDPEHPEHPGIDVTLQRGEVDLADGEGWSDPSRLVTRRAGRWDDGGYGDYA